MKHVGVPAHPLDQPCPCGHAAWLHTGRCLALRGAKVPWPGIAPTVTACECVRTSKEFAK
jgi:hypothetical protein